jgi:hypothetical protein
VPVAPPAAAARGEPAARRRAGWDIEAEEQAEADGSTHAGETAEPRSDRLHQQTRPLRGVEHADDEVHRTEQDPRALLQPEESRAQKDRQDAQRADEDCARRSEQRGFGKLSRRFLALEILDEDETRPDRAGLDEAEQA